jgi:hypothetical protein
MNDLLFNPRKAFAAPSLAPAEPESLAGQALGREERAVVSRFPNGDKPLTRLPRSRYLWFALPPGYFSDWGVTNR